MPDIVDAATRSRMMAGIRGKNTRPEIAIRRSLHAKGLRYRLHPRDVPGKPDMVFPRYRAAIFINGCFWHGHDCHLFRMPSTRPEFWTAKILRNHTRDGEVRRQLAKKSWRWLTIWECAIRGKEALGLPAVTAAAAKWVRAGLPDADIRGGQSVAW